MIIMNVARFLGLLWLQERLSVFTQHQRRRRCESRCRRSCYSLTCATEGEQRKLTVDLPGPSKPLSLCVEQSGADAAAAQADLAIQGWEILNYQGSSHVIYDWKSLGNIMVERGEGGHKRHSRLHWHRRRCHPTPDLQRHLSNH